MTIAAFEDQLSSVRNLTRVFVALAAIVAGGELAVLQLHADVTTRCTPQGSNQLVCRIDQPVVTKKLTEYPEVVFHPGDTVTVEAGGCVQTGGTGATWKLYVDPKGPKSNKYYWGTISIPGATPGVIRLSDAIQKPWTVGAAAAGPLVLTLGYVDDVYHDNGYSGRDNGTGNQCKGVGNAWVQVTITRSPGTATSCAGSTGNSPMDLTWTECDLNGLPLNPKFQYQATHAGPLPSPLTICPEGRQTMTGEPGSIGEPGSTETIIKFPTECVQWPVTYDSGFWCGPHVNYIAVTYQSDVHWWKKSTVFTDDDYNFLSFRSNQEGVDEDRGDMEIEFDSDETIDNFHLPLWKQFKGMVDNDNAALENFVDGRSAVVTSLFGLDCGHLSCGSEQHPAYALAVDFDNTNLQNDSWVVFARNWGDEGFCADDEHDLPMTDLKLMIPWLHGATAVVVLEPATQFQKFSDSDNEDAVPQPQYTVVNGQGILIDFALPSPGTHLGVEGEVHLQWIVSEAARAVLIARSRQQPQAVQPHPADEEIPETRIENLFTQLPAAGLESARSTVTASVAERPLVAHETLPVQPVVKVGSVLRPQSARLIKPVAVANARVKQKHEAIRKALCEAYKNNVPGYPSLCREVNPLAH